MTMNKLLLDSADCEILTSFKEHGSISSMSMALGMDKGQLSRRMTKIAATAPVLIRVQGKWALTPQGIQVVDWFMEATETQKVILTGKDEIIIGTTQVISERKLTELCPRILSETGHKKLRIISDMSKVESDILAGIMDFAFVCSVPQSPEIRYKKIFKSPYVIVLPSSWKDQFKDINDLISAPYVSHSSIEMRNLLGLEDAIPSPVARFDHLSGVRQGVASGIGWAILPQYAVESELKDKKVKILKNHPQIYSSEEFQLWWIPGRIDKKSVQKLIHLLTETLK